MPRASFWPPLAALGLVTVVTGFIFGIVISFVGLAIFLAGLYGWVLEPAA